MGFSYTTVLSITAYLAYHKLAPINIIQRYTPNFSLDGVVEKIKMMPRREARTAVKLYGWRGPHFYYVMASNSVRYHILFVSRTAAKKNQGPARVRDHSDFIKSLNKVLYSFIESDIEITFPRVAKELGCGLDKLYRKPIKEMINKLRQSQAIHLKEKQQNLIVGKIEKFLKEKEKNFETIKVEDIYEYIGLSRYRISTHYPHIYEAIIVLIKEKKRQEFLSKIQMIDETVCRFIDSGIYPSIHKIAHECGVSTKFFTSHPEARHLLRKTNRDSSIDNNGLHES